MSEVVTTSAGPPDPTLDREGVVSLRDQLRALIIHWKSILLCIVLGLGGALALNATTTPQYRAEVTFFVGTQGQGATALQADEFAQRRINSYVGVVQSQRMAAAIIKDSGIDLSPEDLATRISASANTETVLLDVVVTDSDAPRALAIAASVSRTLDPTIGELENRTSRVQLRVISGPALSPYPVAPRKKLNLGLGLLFGTVVGVAQALLRKQLDTSVHSRDELAALTGLPTLAAMQYDRSARRQPVLSPEDRSPRAEAVRQLRTNLRFLAAAHPLEVLAITSSVGAEGKTSTTANLAQSLSSTGRRVILVDADLRKPRVESYLGLQVGIGLTSILIGDAMLDDVVQHWEPGGVDVLAAGPLPPNPSELLSSEAMERLVADLRARYDMVLIDTPPLLPVTDAAVVASHVDGMLLVVRQGGTSASQITQSVEALHSVGARTLGTVMTMERVRRSERRQRYDLAGWTS